MAIWSCGHLRRCANIRLVDTLSRSSIDYVLTRQEQGASFMADELLPTLRQALAGGTVRVLACPGDYRANGALIATLGDLDESWS